MFESAVDLIKSVRAAYDHVRGTSKTLDHTSQQLETLYRSLALVQDEPNLRTARVINQVSRVEEAGKELQGFLEKLQLSQEEQNTAQQHWHAFTSGKDDDKELAAIRGRLDSTRAELMLCIQIVGVGLFTNLDGGFRVMAANLNEVNRKVEEALNFKLRLFELVSNRPPNAGTLQQPFAPDPDSTQKATPDVYNEIYNNITIDQARVITGDIGVQEWLKKIETTRRNIIRNNNMKGKSFILTGNVGGDAAKTFVEGLFN
ncbi:hypothetical protein PG990_004324 [Apiospora arundinis]